MTLETKIAKIESSVKELVTQQVANAIMIKGEK